MQERKMTVAHAAEHEFELATMVVKEANRFNSVISIIMGDKRVSAKSIMGMTYLSLIDGDVITVAADGADEAAAIEGMQAILTE